jgi:Tfp pilus assembly protein PilZ
VPPINSLFVETGGSYPITEDLWLERLLDSDNRFSLAAPREWLEPMGVEIQERLGHWAASYDESNDTTEPQ